MIKTFNNNSEKHLINSIHKTSKFRLQPLYKYIYTYQNLGSLVLKNLSPNLYISNYKLTSIKRFNNKWNKYQIIPTNKTSEFRLPNQVLWINTFIYHTLGSLPVKNLSPNCFTRSNFLHFHLSINPFFSL